MAANNYLKLTIRTLEVTHGVTKSAAYGRVLEHRIETVDTDADDWQDDASDVLIDMIARANIARRDKHVATVSALDPAPFRQILPPGAYLHRVGALPNY